MGDLNKAETVKSWPEIAIIFESLKALAPRLEPEEITIVVETEKSENWLDIPYFLSNTERSREWQRDSQRVLETPTNRPGSRADSAASFQYARGDKINPGDQRVYQLTRPDSRASVTASDHGSVVNDTLHALVSDVEQTTELIRRKQQQMRSERRQFQTEMEVTGRISISPTDDWLNARLKAVSTDDLKRDLNKIKDDQREFFWKSLVE
ncbi:unnamed protein product, partial [Mesorhabditis spiculigera]